MNKRLLLCLASLLLLAALSLTALAETEPERLTMTQLEQLRDEGKVEYVLSDEGYVTWLRGDFYDGKVEGAAGVESAVEHLRDVLGLDEDAQFIKGVAIQMGNGYTYYTIRQFSGGIFVSGSIIKVIADGEGRAAAISSSITPGVGGELDMLIEPEEALEIAKTYLAENQPGVEYIFYPDAVGRTIVAAEDDAGEGQYNAAYIIYTSNPNVSNEQDDRHYLAHYVGSNGRYLHSMPVFAIEDGSVLNAGDAEHFFEGKQEATFTGEVTLHDGSTVEVSVPVLYNEATGKYELADAQRKIAVMDHYAFKFEGSLVPVSSEDNVHWSDNDLITYANYIVVYDAYADIGLYAPDGLGTPIAILSDYRDENGERVDNACYMGIDRGWHCFGSSTLNCYGECVDVMAHEYTHAVTNASMTDILYNGETGAINESFSDILGNIIEMMTGSTQDTSWLVGEISGVPVRSMSDPHLFAQPEVVGDLYYRPMDATLLDFNDRSGVHLNNSLLASVAVDLEKAGMTLDEQFDLWGYLIYALTPRTGFEELLPMIQFSCDVADIPQWKETIVGAFATRGLTGKASDEAYYSEGCGVLQFDAPQADGCIPVRIYLLDAQTHAPLHTAPYWPDGSDHVSCQIAAGDCLVLVRALDGEGTPRGVIYTGDGWQMTEDVGINGIVEADISAAVPVTVEAGSTVTIKPLTAGLD
ncbi:MAG: M4 family metallopeptidase [Aristaeellaceae bacterium]